MKTSPNTSCVSGSLQRLDHAARPLKGNFYSLQKHFALLLTVSAILIASPKTFGASATWNGTTSSAWSLGGNWSATPVPGSGDTATFNNAGNANTTLDLGSGVTISSILFDTPSAAPYTIGSGAVGSQTLTLNASGAIGMSSAEANNQLLNANLTLGTTTAAAAFSVGATNLATTLTFAGAVTHASTVANYEQVKVGGAGNTTFSGAVGAPSGLIYFDLFGTGTTTFSGTTSTFLGSVAVHNGTCVIATANTAGTGSGAWLKAGDTAGQKGVIQIQSPANFTRYNLTLGANATGPGAVYHTGGTLTLAQGASTADCAIGGGASGYGYYSLSGGTLVANEVDDGGLYNASTGVFDMSGGTLTDNGYLIVARGGTTSSGLFNMIGGSATCVRIENNWAGSSGAISILNVGGGSGTATLTVTPSTTLGLSFDNANTAGTYSLANLLANGTLTAGVVQGRNANPTDVLNFNGGNLKANIANANFLTSANIDYVYVCANGGTIDNGGNAITISRALLAPTGTGVTSVSGPTTKGAGYVGAPLVTITGGTYTVPATAYAEMESDGAGAYRVKDIVVTSPGIYSSVSGVGATLVYGGTPTTLATGFTVNTAANTSGGMTFQGSSTTTLSGVNTYSGNTTVSGGTLTIGSAGQLNSGSYAGNISIGSGATFKYNSSAAQTLSGTISGAGTLQESGAGTLTISGTLSSSTTVSGGKLAVTATQLGTSAVTVNSGGDLAVTASGSSQWSPASLTLGSGSTTLEFNGITSTSVAPLNPGSAVANSGTATINVYSGTFAVGSIYPLVANVSSTSGYSLAANPLLALGVSAHLVISSGALAMQVDSVSDIWTGSVNGIWDINNTANWSGHATTYADGDNVLLDDTAAGTTTITVGAQVNPGSMTVNNSTKTYSITSSGGNYIGGSFALNKSGSGTLTLSGSNTYSGGTTINGGTIQAGSDSAIGSAAATLTFSASSSGKLQVNGNRIAVGGLSSDSTATMENANSAAGSLTINSSSAASFSGTIQDGSGGGALALTNSGSGTLTLNGANTYSGGTTLNAGTIVFGNGSALGTGTITANSGTLKWNYTTGSGTMVNNLVVNGPVTLDTSAGNWNMNGNISGNGAITRGTSGILTLYLNGDDSGFTGTFTSPNNANAVVRFINASAGSANASWVFNQPTAGRTTLEFSGAGTISFGSLTGSGPLQSGNATGTKTISAGALGLNDTYSGVIANGSSTVALTKVGTGAMTLSGANTYSGGTTLSAGQLNINNAGSGGTSSAIGTGTLTISGGAIDNTSSGDITLSPTIAQSWNGDFAYAGSVHNLNLGAGAVTLGANRQITVSGNTLTVGGAIGDGGNAYGLTKIGAGTLTLAGVNTYTGNTTISNGTLLLSGSLSSGTVSVATNATLRGAGTINGAVMVNSGGTLTMGTTSALGSLTINNTLALSGTNNFRLNKTGATLTSDKILGTTSITAGGTLNVSTNGGDALAAGDSFALFNAGMSSGWFANVTVPALASGISWDTNDVATSGTLDVYTFTTTTLSVSTLMNTAATVSAAKLTSHASSARGTPVAVSASTPSHGTASISAGALTYTPTSGYSGSDSFTVTFQDGHGWQAMTVNVTVNSQNVGPQLTTVDAGGFGSFTASGLPSTAYTVQISTNLTDVPPFNDYLSVTSAPNGVINFTDTVSIADHGGQSYYRLKQNVAP